MLSILLNNENNAPQENDLNQDSFQTDKFIKILEIYVARRNIYSSLSPWINLINDSSNENDVNYSQ